jgi:hypothetical protein
VRHDTDIPDFIQRFFLVCHQYKTLKIIKNITEFEYTKKRLIFKRFFITEANVLSNYFCVFCAAFLLKRFLGRNSCIIIRQTAIVKQQSATLKTGKLQILIKSLTQPKMILSNRFQIVHATKNQKLISEKYFSRQSQKNAQIPRKEIRITIKILAEIHQEIP